MWQKIDGPDEAFVKALKEDEIPEKPDTRAIHKVRQYYGEDGKKWPLLQISIYDFDTIRKGIRLSVSRKEDSKSWWEEIPIPYELTQDAADMLSNYICSLINWKKKNES
jgi:hypothetical protein